MNIVYAHNRIDNWDMLTVVTLEQSFMALADRTRLRILNLLLQGELCGCDLQHVLGGVSQSAVSRHLNYLKRAGLVADRRAGYRVFYRLADAKGARASLLFDYLRRTFTRDQTFGRDLRSLKRAIRNGACTVSEARLSSRQIRPTRDRRAKA